MYVSEDGTVELCSGQRGRIGKPITAYTKADLAEQRASPKGCERGCSILCAYRDSMIDNDLLGLLKAMLRTQLEGSISWQWRGAPAPADHRASVRHLPVVNE
jgi:hypothetical protein